jgi:hypothetical protein
VNPEQVLDMQADLLYYTEQKMFQEITAGIIGSAHGARVAGLAGRGAAREAMYTPKEDIVAHMMARVMPNHVRTSYAYRVTPDMCSLVEFAASQLDETDEFDRHLAPTGCGLVRFEKALPMHDARGKLMKIHWMLWGPATVEVVKHGKVEAIPGIAVSWFNDHFEDPDDYASEILAVGDTPDFRKKVIAAVGRWGFIGCDVLEQGRLIGAPLSPLSPGEAAAILADGDNPSPHTNTHRYIHALWLMLNQTITKTEDEYVRKTALKRAQRIGLPGRVTVITLRRTAGSRNQGESLVEWSHRWVVRGHWRWQPHGPQLSEKRRIWIAPHVKGPESKPLIVSDKVYNLSR